jgi:hypothetical protein
MILRRVLRWIEPDVNMDPSIEAEDETSVLAVQDEIAASEENFARGGDGSRRPRHAGSTEGNVNGGQHVAMFLSGELQIKAFPVVLDGSHVRGWFYFRAQNLGSRKKALLLCVRESSGPIFQYHSRQLKQHLAF